MTRTTKAIVKTLRSLGLEMPEGHEYKIHRVAKAGYDEAWSWFLSDDSGIPLAASQWSATECLQAHKEQRTSLDITDHDNTFHDHTPTLMVERADPYNYTHYGQKGVWGPPCQTVNKREPRTTLSEDTKTLTCPKCKAYAKRRDSPAAVAARKAQDEADKRMVERWKQTLGW